MLRQLLREQEMTDDDDCGEHDSMARPPHQPTDEYRRIILAMGAYGIPQEDIAKVIGISKPTLIKYYGDDIAIASTKANAKIVERLFKIATTGDSATAVTALIWWTKCRLRWKPPAAEQSDKPAPWDGQSA